MKVLSKFAKTFSAANEGSVAIIFASALVPVIIGVGVAVDYGRALNARLDLKTATDAAALAAAKYVRKQNEDAVTAFGKRKALAESVFSANALSNASYSPQVTVTKDAEGKEISVRATLNIPTTLASIIQPSLAVTAQSTAATNAGTAPLCILTLNGSASEATKIWGTAQLQAPQCATQTNSSSASGLASGGSSSAKAAQFCVSGGASGANFDPEAKEKCDPITDPYAGQYTPSKLSSQGINVTSGCTYNGGVRVKKNTEYVANNVMVFCGGMTIQAGAVTTFRPGVYVFYDELLVSAGASLEAPEGVTLYFANQSYMAGTGDGFLTVQGGGNVNLVAPKTGGLAGMAIIQPTVSSYTGGSTPANVHTMIGGGVIDIVGNVYTPQSKVRVTGNGEINGNSQYFSIISDFLEIEGNGVLTIHAAGDNTVYGVPGMPTTSLGGEPRLVQ